MWCAATLVPDGFSVMVVLHEEGMRHVQAPHLVLRAELSAVPEHALACIVVLPVPVDACHGHQACSAGMHW